MIKAGTAVAKMPYSRAVGNRLGEDLIAKLGKKPDMCWLFCEPGNGMEDLVEGVCDVVATRNLVGCTTDGEVSTDGFSTRSAVLGGIVSPDIGVEVTSISNIKVDSERAGRELAAKFPRTTRHIQIFSDGLTGNGSALLRGVHSVFGPEVVVSGGTAGDARQFKQTWQFMGRSVLTDSAVAISLSGPVVAGTGVRSGWFSAGAPRKVIRARGNVVYELEGESMLAAYRRYLGPLASQLPAVGVQFPFGIVDEKLSLGEDPVLRAPMALNEADGSVTFAGEIPEGCTINLTTGGSHTHLLDASAEAARRAMTALDSAVPSMIFFYSCMARKILLGSRTGEELQRISAVVGRRVPAIGFYTYGEFCPSTAGTPCKLHNETATVTILASR